jgi:hypothetical protein
MSAGKVKKAPKKKRPFRSTWVSRSEPMFVLTDYTDNGLTSKEFKVAEHNLYIRVGNDSIKIELTDSHTIVVRSREHRLVIAPDSTNRVALRLEQ